MPRLSLRTRRPNAEIEFKDEKDLEIEEESEGEVLRRNNSTCILPRCLNAAWTLAWKPNPRRPLTPSLPLSHISYPLYTFWHSTFAVSHMYELSPPVVAWASRYRTASECIISGGTRPTASISAPLKPSRRGRS
jgi:hypothetical protein